jgi:hypothetical protein
MLTSRERIKVRGELSAILLAINIILIIRNCHQPCESTDA